MKIPALNSYMLKRLVQQQQRKQAAEEKDILNIPLAFPMFSPKSGGGYHERSALTKACVNNTLPAIVDIVKTFNIPLANISKIDDLAFDQAAAERCLDLSKLFLKYGSDKSTDHDYHKLYGVILSNKDSIKTVLEIGLGTNNLDVVSNMGAHGRPGASLRAFRDFLPNSLVYSADIDSRILFAEERIQTFYVDQLHYSTLEKLGQVIPEEVDLIIDDGLHSPDANLNTLRFALGKVAPGGWIVIEDIRTEALPVWTLVSGLLSPAFRSCILQAKAGSLFAVQRLSEDSDFLQRISA